jgi:hypothetical protein
MATSIPAIPIETLLAYRARLVNALLSSASVVEFEDRRIERRTVDELLAALGWLDGQIGGAVDGTRGFPRVRRTTTCKDL